MTSIVTSRQQTSSASAQLAQPFDGRGSLAALIFQPFSVLGQLLSQPLDLCSGTLLIGGLASLEHFTPQPSESIDSPSFVGYKTF